MAQFVICTIVSLAGASGCWWWFARSWKRGEIEARTGLYRVEIEPEEYWFTMGVFGVGGLVFLLMAGCSLALVIGFGY